MAAGKKEEEGTYALTYLPSGPHEVGIPPHSQSTALSDVRVEKG